MKKYFIISIASIVLSGFCTLSYSQFIVNSGIEIKNSAQVITNGSWTNAAGTTILNNGTINTSEAFINNGFLDTKSIGGFKLTFATDLNFQPGGSEMGFLIKDGIGAALVTGSISVKDSLVLKNGLVQMLNVADTIGLKSGALLLVGANSYVQGGLFARAGTGDFLFPLGKNGLYLPVKMYKVQAQKVIAAVLDAPLMHTAGPGVDALIGFPYAWKVAKKVATDTAAYVEVNYPTTLPVVINPIMARQIPGSQYASMGARIRTNSGTRVTVKSYSRRLNGLFTVAQGFPSDPVTDSLALVALYNGTGGATWTNRTSWLNGTIDTWFGVTVTGQSITGINLANNNLTGPVPDPLVDILSLQTINLSGNKISTLPDFTLNPEITSLNVTDNNLDFASLEPNATITGINYIIQADIGTPINTEIPVGTPYQFSIPSGGLSSQYQWKRNGIIVPGANSANYPLPAISRQTMGTYLVEITNPKLPGLTLKSATQKVLAYANVSGKLFAETGIPAQKGELLLYKVQPGAFALQASVPVLNDGSYLFEKILLDDYQIRGFADTLTYARAIPTYYKNTIFWEEADTVYLENNLDSLDIISQLEPEPPSGRGSISGFLQEDDGTGRVKDPEKNKRIKNAGVSARRVESTGRSKGEILTLVAYVFTNDQGEFTLPNLPTGKYRLNFQYPGYPMDETSYTTITIGTAFESQVLVEANVLNGKINVRKLVITGLYQAENYSAEVYPNPAADFIVIQFGSTYHGRIISLSDMSGKIVHSEIADHTDVSVNVQNLQKGIYLMQIKENGIKVKTLKISIE